MSFDQHVFSYANVLRRQDTSLANLTFNGTWQDTENCYAPQLQPKTTLDTTGGSCNVVLDLGGDEFVIRCIALMATTLRLKDVRRIVVTENSVAKDIVEQDMLYIEDPVNGNKHIVIMLSRDYTCKDVTIHFEGTGKTYEIGALHFGKAMVTNDLQDARWSVRYADNSPIGVSRGRQVFAPGEATLYRTYDVSVSNVNAVLAYGAPMLGREVEIGYTTLNGWSHSNGWYELPSSSINEELRLDVPKNKNGIDDKFYVEILTNVIATADGGISGTTLGANIGLPSSIPLDGRTGYIFQDPDLFGLNLNVTGNTSASSTLYLKIASAFEVLEAPSASAPNLDEMLRTASITEPVIYIGRYNNAAWHAATLIYGRIAKPAALTHTGGNYFSTSFQLEETL